VEVLCKKVYNKKIRSELNGSGVTMKYPMTKAPKHPKANIAGDVPTHILIVEERLGRPLKKNELVHHVDFNKHNSGCIEGTNISNLLLMSSRQEHQQLPELQARFLVHKGLFKEFLEWYQEEKEIVQIEHKLEKAQRKLTKFRRKHNG